MSNNELARQAATGRRSRQPRERDGIDVAARTSTNTDSLATEQKGVLELRGGRVIVMTERAYILLLQVMYEHAPHVLKYAFYDMGYRAGIDMRAALAERADDPERVFEGFVEQYTQAGYGNLEITHFDLAAPEARLSGTALFEAGLAPKAGIYRTPRVVDHYSRGMLAGFMSELLKREVVCEEVACQFRGDPRCEFVILPFQE